MVFDVFLGGIVLLGIWIAGITAITSAARKMKRNRRMISSDGHVIPKDQDITCEGRDGHRHLSPTKEEIETYGRRYIVHNDPENGYVILNGVKRKLSECKDL